jgi:hypothetical protein
LCATSQLVQGTLGALVTPRHSVESQHFGAQATGEAAVEYADETPCRDAREPLGERFEGDAGRGKIPRIGIVYDELVAGGSMARKGNDHDIVGITLGECGEA